MIHIPWRWIKTRIKAWLKRQYEEEVKREAERLRKESEE